MSYLYRQRAPQMDQSHGSGNQVHQPSLGSLLSWRPTEKGGPCITLMNVDNILVSHRQSWPTYSLGLVLTSTLSGPLLLKHCLRRASTSENGLRNTRSPFMANSFFPTSRPAILNKIINIYITRKIEPNESEHKL